MYLIVRTLVYRPSMAALSPERAGQVLGGRQDPPRQTRSPEFGLLLLRSLPVFAATSNDEQRRGSGPMSILFLRSSQAPS
jgi:hypothetical protein